MDWEGRRLTQYTYYNSEDDTDEIYSFTYNDDGIRTSKNSNGTLHTYTLSGSTIVAEEFSTYLFVYLYDEAGEPIGLQYRKSTDAANVFNCYLFEKNLQGDVVGIYNTSGTKLATYTYDAWGVMTVSVTSGITTTDRLAAILIRSDIEGITSIPRRD